MEIIGVSWVFVVRFRDHSPQPHNRQGDLSPNPLVAQQMLIMFYTPALA